MADTIATRSCSTTLVEDFQRLEGQARDACKAASAELRQTLPQMAVGALERLHVRHLERLGLLAGDGGSRRSETGSERAGRVDAAAAADGDFGVLVAVDAAERTVIAAYERALRDTALPARLAPAFRQALKELRQGRNKLEATARAVA